MKRKVIKPAETTHSITPPKAWTVLNNLKKGDLVEVEEQNNLLGRINKLNLQE